MATPRPIDVRTVLKLIHRTVGRLLPATLLSFRYDAIPGRVHVDDQMLRSNEPTWVAHYLNAGQEAVKLIEQSLASDGRRLDDVTSVLVFPSGYGRVIRHLVTRVSPKRITACDIDPNAVRFCTAEFGIHGLQSHVDLASITLPDSYDIIFIGSLLTHLPPEQCIDLLRTLVPRLCPRGHLVFTTQGESCMNHLEWYGPEFKAAEASIREQVLSRGIGFLPYRGKATYGICIHSQQYVSTTMREHFRHLRLVEHKERAWDHHQDVWAYANLG
jgi:Methyltransferase domain